MIKKVIRCVGFILVTILTLNFIYNVLKLKDTNGGEQEIYSVVNQLGNTPKNTVDVLFMGTSHCYNSVYPAVMWDEYGISAFDLAITSQPKFCTYYYLREVLKKQSPKVVCVEVFNLATEGVETEGEGVLYRNYLGLNSVRDSYNLMKDYKEKNMGAYIFKWPIVHTRYRELSKNDFIESNADKYGRGAEFRMGETGGYFSAMSRSKEIIPISDENREWVDRMYALSQKEGFELVLFLSPFAVFGDEREIINGVAEYADTLGIPLINLIDEAGNMGYDPAVDMMNDFHHCNMNGAAKVSRYLGSYLCDSFALTDHRGDSKYYQWDMDLKMYNQVRVENALEELKTPEEYLERLSKCNNLSIILSVEGDFEHTIPYLEYFGISGDDAVEGGKWLYKDKQLKKLMSNELGNSTIVDLDRFTSVKVSVNENTEENLIYNMWPMVATDNGLTVIIYDTLLEKCVDVRGY